MEKIEGSGEYFLSSCSVIEILLLPGLDGANCRGPAFKKGFICQLLYTTNLWTLVVVNDTVAVSRQCSSR
eukprot:scaffold8818_cov73-Cyclotella_meneghiniana.AAC.12